ncbi:MAG: RNB domain-containing ribonuclease [Treponema sp.]|nr:RNB domain-containing ribonuclease [Treponema sp.]
MATNDTTPVTNTIVLYKSSAAIITDKGENGKYPIRYQSAPATATKPAAYAQQSVRTKDFTVLSGSAASSLEKVLDWAAQNAPSEEEMYSKDSSNALASQVKECYELLCSDEETANASHPFEDLVSLFRGEVKADECWGNYLALKNTVYFKQDLKALLDGKLVFSPRPQAEIDELVKKADAKGQEAQKREEFLERLKERKLLPEDSIFMTDVENLAYGKTDKSRTMHDAHLKETPENAHKLLLETGIWDITRNPYPIRWGLSMKSATEGLASPPDEERIAVEGISYAIDNEYSTDPDDAVAWDGTYLWVHIADPASTVMPDSSIDKSARARGATLYLPEGAARMLAEDCLEDYALGLTEKSRALSFRIKLDADGNIADCAVCKTLVNVKRLTYAQADTMKDSPELKPLFDIARKNVERRVKAGAVMIDIPQVHITLDENKKVSIEPDERAESSDMIREMMLLAGEGAARFAFQNRIPFPFISQDAPTLPQDLPEGLAGQFRLRRCMHRRSVGISPAMHCGLGIAMYTQVTSPLRRYSDLIAHQQLRAFLDGRELINKDDMLMRISEGDAGFQAAHKAERKADMHWTLVYLLQNPGWTGEAILVDRGGKQPQLFIPSLGLETYMGVDDSVALNEKIRVKADKINLSELSVEFTQTE